MFEFRENVKKLRFEGKWAKLCLEICLLRQSGQNVWNKIGKCIRIGQDKKSTISTFVFFNCYYHSLIPGRGMGTMLCVQPNLGFF